MKGTRGEGFWKKGDFADGGGNLGEGGNLIMAMLVPIAAEQPKLCCTVVIIAARDFAQIITYQNITNARGCHLGVGVHTLAGGENVNLSESHLG